MNSGKSTLLQEAIKTLKLENPDRSIVNIDLRSRTFRSIEAFSSTIIRELDTWYSRLFKLLPDTVKAKLSISSSQVELTFQRGKDRPTECLQEVYDALSNALPEWSWLKGENIPSPILCIDEANRLQALLDDKRGNIALDDFLAWIVLNTKQMNKFHVIMASSDSFFHRWISQYVDSTCFRNFVVGHLSKEEAKRYWENEISKYDDRESNVMPLQFEDVYRICGGCIHLMAETHRIHKFSGGIIQPYSMSYVSQRRAKFVKALLLPSKPSYTTLEPPTPKWKKEDLQVVMSQLVKANYVEYKSLCKDIGQQSVDSLIEFNIIHLRPCAMFPYDYEMVDDSIYPIITPHLPCDVAIMKELLHSKI